MDLVCQSCQSENVQRLSAVYEGGLSHVHTTSTGTVSGLRSDIGVGTIRSSASGTVQTVASQRARPPVKKRYVKPLLGIFVAFVISTGFTGHGNSDLFHFCAVAVMLVLLVAIPGWIIYAFQYNAMKWPAQMTIWNNSYLCNRCNAVFCVG